MFARVGSLGVNNLGSIYRVPPIWHPQHLGSRFLPYAPPGLLNQDFTVMHPWSAHPANHAPHLACPHRNLKPILPCLKARQSRHTYSVQRPRTVSALKLSGYPSEDGGPRCRRPGKPTRRLNASCIDVEATKQGLDPSPSLDLVSQILDLGLWASKKQFLLSGVPVDAPRLSASGALRV